MAITALNSAATGLRALSTNIDVIANNLANSETGSFKRSRVNFEDLMYLSLKSAGSQNQEGDKSPEGISVGLGTRISNTQLDFTQGSMETTNRDLDVAIQGPGFFRVKTLSTVGDGFGYTRNGNFLVNDKGEMVVGTGDGYKLDPAVTIPPNSTDITITPDGQISAVAPGSTTKKNVGTIQIYNFINPQGLDVLGGSLYQTTDASGPATAGKPGDNGSGTLLQGYLEGSNVDPVKELVTMIKTQRAFELNSQSIQSADQALQTIGNLRRS